MSEKRNLISVHFEYSDINKLCSEIEIHFDDVDDTGIFSSLVQSKSESDTFICKNLLEVVQSILSEKNDITDF